jgi:hypothetical protein
MPFVIFNLTLIYPITILQCFYLFALHAVFVDCLISGIQLLYEVIVQYHIYLFLGNRITFTRTNSKEITTFKS